MMSVVLDALPAALFGAAYLALGLAVGLLVGDRELGAIRRELEALEPKVLPPEVRPGSP
jgi:hypothetical protein